MDEYKDMVYMAWNIPLQVRPGLEQKQRWMKKEEVVVTAGDGKGSSRSTIPALKNLSQVPIG